MICLAKTPANQEFKSKHHQRQQEDSASDSAPSLPLAEQEEDEVEVGEREEVVRRAPPAAKRALVRNSKSEDQLNVDAQLSPPDDYSGSVNTLLDTSGIGILPLDDSATSSAASPSRHFHQPEEPRHPTKIQQSSPPQSTTKESASHQMLLSQTKRGHPSPPKGQRPFDPTSPEELIDTSSLMSCSEHYNAESVLDNKISPNSSSSPDTPEWSLLDSIHKKNGQAVGGGLATIDSMEDSFTNESLNNGNNNGALTNNNKTIISIGDQQQQQLQQHKQQNIMLLQDDILEPPEEVVKHVVTSPGSGSLSSNRTITPEQDFKELLRETTANQQQVVPMQTSSSIQNSIMSNSSEEDSDLDSLHSYHPPVKVIDVPSAVRLAKRLYYLHGFKKTDVSRQLSKNTEYNSVVAEEYLKFFDFESCSLDAALRQFLSHFVLTGETQERERVLLYFSKRYLECNPSVHGTLFNSPDAVHTLTCAIMLLNTDLHGTSIPRKMTGNEFIENLSDLNEGKDFPKDLLRSVYNAIKEKAIPWAAAEDSANLTPVTHSGTNSNEAMGGSQLQPQQQQQQQHNHPASAISIGQGAAGGINPFLSLPDPDQAIDYKNGYVMRKSCFDASGKKTKLGKRSWKMFFLTLRDMVLYCFKDEKTVRTPGAFEDLNSAIRIHHGLAVRAMDYTKKQFVFRLYTADQAQFLFQTSDEKELLTWIDTINYVVASFSSPQLPAPCSSGGRFQRPLLPSSKTRLEPSEQLQSHENQLVQLRDEMEDHLQNPPGKGTRAGAKQSVLLAYKEKTDHLTFEILRYETYVLTLRTKSGHE